GAGVWEDVSQSLSALRREMRAVTAMRPFGEEAARKESLGRSANDRTDPLSLKSAFDIFGPHTRRPVIAPDARNMPVASMRTIVIARRIVRQGIKRNCGMPNCGGNAAKAAGGPGTGRRRSSWWERADAQRRQLRQRRHLVASRRLDEVREALAAQRFGRVPTRLCP